MKTGHLDELLARLRARADDWAKTPALRRLEYLRAVGKGCLRVAARQAEVASRAKAVPPGSGMAGEEWAHSYLIMRTIRLLSDAIGQIAAHGRMKFPTDRLRVRKNGQLVAQVFPLSVPDRILYPGFHGEVWLEPGVSAENLSDHMARAYREETPRGEVDVILGAGNVAAIGPTDLLQKLFVEGHVCLFKHNPVNEYLEPLLEESFAPLIRDGFVATCKGGADVGAYLASHPSVDGLHLTGSDRTYESIVFGTGSEGAERKARREPLLTKRISAELGNVTPIIVAPGPWDDGDFRFHAENIATQVANNSGFNCLSSRVLITPEGWEGTTRLVAAIAERLSQAAPRPAYYPGAETLYREILSDYPQAIQAGKASEGGIPYTLIPGVDSGARDARCFRSEYFIPVLVQTSLPGKDAAGFMRNAVEFANEMLWGTLCANLIVHPRAVIELGEEFEKAIADLRYGSVAINQWVAMGYAWGSTSWGAYPGSTPWDIQSGVGTVHNTCMFDRPEKSVAFGPFRVRPTPPWFSSHRGKGRVFARATRLESDPSILKALLVGAASLRA